MNAILRLLVIVLLPIACLQAQIPSYVPTNGLIGWWPFNGNANDESGNGLNGTVNGASLTLDRNGNPNRAYNFDGLSGYINIGNSSKLNTGTISVSCWINPDKLLTPSNFGPTILSKREPSGWGASFQMNIARHSFWADWTIGGNGGIYHEDSSKIIIDTNTYAHLVYTHDINKVKLYLNGRLVEEINSPGLLDTNSIPLWFGARPDSIQFFSGVIDDIAIWNRALTQNEIGALYLSGIDTIPIIPTVKTISTVSCFGGNDGIATVTHEGGIGPYSYAWNTTPVQTTQTATNLSAGTYTVTVKDSRDSIAMASITITQPPAITNVIASVTKNVDCFGASSGSASVSNPSGGTPPYAYSWNTVPEQKTQNAIDLKAGSYTVTVTDSKGCIAQSNVNITQPSSAVEVDSAIIENQISCYGFSDGIISIPTPIGGTPPYTVVWNTQPVSYTERVVGVGAGTYTAVVIDAKGCIAETSITIGQPAEVIVESPKDTVVLIQTNAIFAAATNNERTRYQWQTNLGTGFQDIQDIFQYLGTKTPVLNVLNCTLFNHNQPFRCILTTNGCYDTTDIATLSIRTNVSVDESNQVDALSISPNPTGESDQFLVRFAETPNQDISIELLDILGSIHYSNTLQAGSESCTIPVQGLSSGMYMLRVRMNNEVFIEKVIVN